MDDLRSSAGLIFAGLLFIAAAISRDREEKILVYVAAAVALACVLFTT